MAEKEGSSLESENETNEGATKIKVGEKEYSADDVENMINQQAAVTKKSQEQAEVDAALSRYGVDASTFIDQADGVFSVMTSLVDQGIIDGKGNILVKPNEEPKPTGDTENGFNDLFTPARPDPVRDKKMEVAMAALDNISGFDKKLEILNARLERLDEVQSSIIRSGIQDKIAARHPELDDDDISKVIASAVREKGKDIFEMAKEAALKKNDSINILKERFAKEWGINVKEIDENKLMEKDPAGGAAMLVDGKKLSFSGKDGVRPIDATREFMRKNVGV